MILLYCYFVNVYIFKFASFSKKGVGIAELTTDLALQNHMTDTKYRLNTKRC